MNFVKTTVLLTLMTMLFGLVGWFIGGQTGMLIALAFAAATNMFAWWNSGSMVLKMHGARLVTDADAPELVSMVRQLADNAGLPMPAVYIIETDQPNAFATGRNYENAAVAASRGLLNTLTPQEVAAVMAHELAHVRSRDTLTMTITATLAGAIGMIANFGMFFGGNQRNNPFGFIGIMATVILAPMAAGIVQMAVSRSREYEADRDGAEICGNPLWLASALRKIAIAAGRTINDPAERSPATAHMFIINPLNGQRMDGLFSTHPATENRIAALQKMDEEMGRTSPRNDVRLPNRRDEPDYGRQPAPQARGPWGSLKRDGQSARKRPWG